MFINGKTLHELEEADLLSLIGRTYESKFFDFKRDAYLDGKSTKKEHEIKAEFCADLCSFANTSGGWIICGMDEKAGEASELCGLGHINIDELIRKLRQVAEDNIDPRIPGLDFHPVNLTTNGKAIVIYIPRSFALPHYSPKIRKFYNRHAGGKREMDLDELRRAFNLSQQWTDQIREFRQKRVTAIKNNDLDTIPVKLAGGLGLIVHCIPLSSFEIGNSVDLSIFKKNNWKEFQGGNRELFRFVELGHFNLEGFILPLGRQSDDKPYLGYNQIFRNGVIETVKFYPQSADQDALIHPKRMEDDIRNYMMLLLDTVRKLAVNPPYSFMVSMIGTRGRKFDFSEYWHLLDDYKPQRLIRDVYLFSDAVLESHNTDLTKTLELFFETLWNIAGLMRPIQPK